MVRGYGCSYTVVYVCVYRVRSYTVRILRVGLYVYIYTYTRREEYIKVCQLIKGRSTGTRATEDRAYG